MVDKRADFAIGAIGAIGNYETLQIVLVMLRMPEPILNAKAPRVYSIDRLMETVLNSLKNSDYNEAYTRLFLLAQIQ
jgi:hypothetical protein